MQRNIHIDLLRFISAFAVVLIHVPSLIDFFSIGGGVSAWLGWSVPCFIMISGAFMLQKDISLKDLWKNRISRLLFLLLSWNYFYWLISGRELPSVFKCTLILGEAHMWYMYMLIGLYAMIPLLKSIINTGYSKYFLLLWLVLNVLLPSINIGNGWTINNFRDNLIIQNLGYTGYFVLGHYLMNNKLDKKSECLLYITGLLSFIIYPFLSKIGLQVSCSSFTHSYFNIFVFFQAIALFYFFANRRTRFSKKVGKIVLSLSSLSLGVYLVHPLILNLFEKLLFAGNFNRESFVLFFFTWAYVILLSLLLTKFLKSRPLLNSFVE